MIVDTAKNYSVCQFESQKNKRLMYTCCNFCLASTTTSVMMRMGEVHHSLDDSSNSRHDSNDDSCDDKKNIVSCRTLHVGSIPYNNLNHHHNSCLCHSCNSNSSSSSSLNRHCQYSDTDDLNYSVEMTLRDFQHFLEEGQCWHNSSHHNTSGSSTATQRQQQLQLGRNRSRTFLLDPCNALGAEVSLGDFLMHNHNNIDIKVHEAIQTEEIQVTDNRRSAVLVITERRQHHHQEHEIWDDEFNSSLEVQPIHTFDDLTPPNLMNASFGLQNDDEAATVDMNESYSEDPYDESGDSVQELGGWISYDEDDEEDGNDNINSFILPLRPMSLYDLPLMPPQNNSSILSNVERPDAIEFGAKLIQPKSDDRTNINCLENRAIESFRYDDSRELCIDSDGASHNNDVSPTQNAIINFADSSKHAADSDGAARIERIRNETLIAECSTDGLGSHDQTSMCRSNNNIATHSFLSFIVVQILALAISYYLRHPQDFRSTTSI